MGGRYGPRTLTLIAALPLVAAGCGGGSQPRVTNRTPPAVHVRAQFIGRADAVCRMARAAEAKFRPLERTLLAAGDTKSSFAQAAKLARRVGELDRTELTRLRALAPPGADAPTAFLGEESLVVAVVGRLGRALVRSDRPAIARAEADLSRVATTAKGLARAYGFKVCANGAGGHGLS